MKNIPEQSSSQKKTVYKRRKIQIEKPESRPRVRLKRTEVCCAGKAFDLNKMQKIKFKGINFNKNFNNKMKKFWKNFIKNLKKF